MKIGDLVRWTWPGDVPLMGVIVDKRTVHCTQWRRPEGFVVFSVLNMEGDMHDLREDIHTIEVFNA